jgi:hypothetical protein
MQVDFYTLKLEANQVTCYLWTPWRASALEHRLFDAVRSIPGVELVQEPDELRAQINNPKAWKLAQTAISRVMMGWQEEAADDHRERRGWRWLLEGDTDAHGYDHSGEPLSLWAYLRLAIDRGSPEEADKGEDIDLQGFGLRFLPVKG